MPYNYTMDFLCEFENFKFYYEKTVKTTSKYDSLTFGNHLIPETSIQ